MLAALLFAALLLAAPVLSARAVGDRDASGSTGREGFPRAATVISFGPVGPLPPPAQMTPAPVATPVPTPAPTPAPPPLPPPPPAPAGLCPDAISVNVVDAALVAEVQAGADLLAEYFGCQKFRLDGTGLPVKFGAITPLFNAKVLGYAHNAPGAYEIWLNPDCWGVVNGWAGVIAHEFGHYLGWQHGDDHPYMWLAPPPGSYARPGDAVIICG